MKKILIIVTVISVTLAGILGMRYISIENEAKEIKELKLNSISGEENGNKSIKETIYIPNKNFDKLVKRESEFEYTADREKIVQMVFDKIFAEMKIEGTIEQVPELLNCYFHGKDLYINVKSNKIFLGNDTKTLYILYAITNSITELGGVSRIKFLIDNQEGKGVLDAYYEKNLKF